MGGAAVGGARGRGRGRGWGALAGAGLRARVGGVLRVACPVASLTRALWYVGGACREREMLEQSILQLRSSLLANGGHFEQPSMALVP